MIMDWENLLALSQLLWMYIIFNFIAYLQSYKIIRILFCLRCYSIRHIIPSRISTFCWILLLFFEIICTVQVFFLTLLINVLYLCEKCLTLNHWRQRKQLSQSASSNSTWIIYYVCYIVYASSICKEFSKVKNHEKRFILGSKRYSPYV